MLRLSVVHFLIRKQSVPVSSVMRHVVGSRRAFATHKTPTPVRTPRKQKQESTNSVPPATPTPPVTDTTTTTTTTTSPSSYAPPPVRKKRVKKAEDPPEGLAVTELDAFKIRLMMAVLNETSMHEAERELEKNESDGLHDKNKRALEAALMESYDTLFPLGFHSVWLYKLAKKYSGCEFCAKYLLKNKGKKWVLFVPRRQILLWQECTKDFLTTCNNALVKGEISVSDVLDIITVYYVDTLERDKHIFLDDQIEKPIIRPLHEVITMVIETLDEDVAAKFYIRMITEHPLIIEILQPEELRELLSAFIDRISSEHAKRLKQEIKSVDALKNMVELIDRKLGKPSQNPHPSTTPQQPSTNAKT